MPFRRWDDKRRGCYAVQTLDRVRFGIESGSASLSCPACSPKGPGPTLTRTDHTGDYRVPLRADLALVQRDEVNTFDLGLAGQAPLRACLGHCSCGPKVARPRSAPTRRPDPKFPRHSVSLGCVSALPPLARSLHGSLVWLGHPVKCPPPFVCRDTMRPLAVEAYPLALRCQQSQIEGSRDGCFGRRGPI